MTHSTTASAARAALLATSLATASLLLPAAAPAFDTEANVNDVRDLPDPSPNVGGCESTAGTCTLRAAIMRANKRTGQHVIRLPAGTFTLTRAGREEDDAETGDLDVRRDTTILGAGAGVTIIDAAGIDRVLDLSGKRNITLKDLTIRGGDAESVDFDGRVGGGIRIGVFNDGNGTVKLTRVVVENNFSNGSGGGVFMQTTRSLRIERSAIVDNTAFGVNSFGSAIEIQGGTLTIADTTISGNSAPDRDGLTVIDLFGGAVATIRRSTIVGGPSRSLIGNFAFGTATVDLADTILQASGSSCVGRDPANSASSLVVFDSGNNIESGDTCGLLAFKGNLVNTSAQLSPLLRAGGTAFHNLGKTSPAIDHIPAAACGAAIDQRGLPRPRSGTTGSVASCDVGAIEVQGTRGEPAVSAPQTAARRVGDPLDLTYAWRVPDGGTWRDLATLDLRLVEDGRIVFWLRWFEDGDRFVELSSSGEPLDAASSFRPGFVLDDGAASSAEGPESPEVTLHLPLLATRVRSGGLTAEVSATDDGGATQPFSAVAILGDGGGALRVPSATGRIPISR